MLSTVTARTDDLDKWKNCKGAAHNLGMAYLAGIIKCSVASPLKDPYSMFICSTLSEGFIGVLQPETLGCAVEINRFVDETELIGDCVIC